MKLSKYIEPFESYKNFKSESFSRFQSLDCSGRNSFCEIFF